MPPVSVSVLSVVHSQSEGLMDSTTYQRFVERYESGQLPWALELPPPEVVALVTQVPPGRVLDLGCGYGRSAIYLAQHGWLADGVDFVPLAVAEAEQRAAMQGVSDKTRFFVASITDLTFLQPGYDLAIDIGCMHVLDDVGLQTYQQELMRLLRPGALYLLFVHLRQGDEPEDGRPHGIFEETIFALFGRGFELEKVEHGTTQVEDKPVWHSAWFWFRRQEPG